MRRTFTAAMERDTRGTDLPRYVAVLDALLAWSAAHASDVVAQAGKRDDVVRFVRAGTQELFWSAQVVRGAAPRLEIHLPAGRALSETDRAETMRTLNAHSRDTLDEGERLRIGFGALKNADALAEVLALMDWLLVEPGARTARAERAERGA